MKIGLVTAYFADYGSYYQATALYYQLIKMGHEVEIIHESVRYPRSPRLFASSIASRVLPAELNRRIAKNAVAYNTYLILKSNLSRISVAKPALCPAQRYARYDCVIVGSDELWSPTNHNVRFIPDYFGIGVPCPHFSYGTSGHTMRECRVSPKRKQAIVEGLRSFYRLSVRDSVTKKWVEEWLQEPGACEQVLDPTLLNPYFASPAPPEPFMVIYGEHFSEEQRDAIVRRAREKGWRTLAVAWRHTWCDAYLKAAGAQDIQKAFGRAAYCAVSTFHGAIFSILAQRPFAAFMTALRGAKLRSLLSDLGLADRLYNPDMGELPDWDINYPAVEGVLARRREESMRYLSAALKNCEEGFHAL